MRSRRKRNFAALLAMLLLLCGCTSLKSIQEDSVREDLPQIDPEAGTTRTITATLYYRLSSEPYLVAIRHSLTVRSNESAEDAIVRTLLSGVPPLAENVSNAFADGTEALEIARDGSILYVTLSEEYLDDSALREVKEESSQLLAREEITEAEYNARIAAAKEELYVDRRADYMQSSTQLRRMRRISASCFWSTERELRQSACAMMSLELRIWEARFPACLSPWNFRKMCWLPPQAL